MRRFVVLVVLLLAAACMASTPRTTATASGAAAPPPVQGLGAAEREVLDVVRRLFDAMRTQDSAAARALFEPGTRLQSVARRANGVVTVSEDSIGMWLRSIGTPHAQVYDERTANERVLVDEPYAVAWMDYTFYLGDQKSHCGVDAFQLVRRAEGWRIFSITDTRRRENCPDLPKR